MNARSLSRRTTFAILGVLLIGTAGLATAAASGAADDIVPMMKGRFAAFERSLARDSVALAVHVGTFDGEERSAAEGAIVSVYRMPGPDRNQTPAAEPLATQTTDADGRTVFELRPGRYVVDVTHGNDTGRHALPVPKDTRLGVVFDADGNAHFGSKDRRDLARHGEPRVLMVRVGATDGENRSAVADAIVNVTHTPPGRDRDGGDAIVLRTDENGTAVFHLRPGRYVVNVTTPDGDTAEKSLFVRANTGLLVLFDENGDAHIKKLEREDRFERAHDGPPRGPPADRPGKPTPPRDAPMRD